VVLVKFSLQARLAHFEPPGLGRGIQVRKVQLRPTVAVAAALASSSIKTSQIDAVVKREEESPTPARFYAITPAPPSFSFMRETNLLYCTAHLRSRTTTLHRTPSLFSSDSSSCSYRRLYYTIKSKRRRFLQSRELFVETT